MDVYGHSQDSSLNQIDESLITSHYKKVLEEALGGQILKDIQDFDDAAIPPNLAFAELHHKCSSIGMPIDRKARDKIKICPCCCDIETQKYPLCISSKSITKYGAAIPLFFEYSHFLIMLSILFSALGAVGGYYVIRANCSRKNSYKYNRCGINLSTLVDSSLRDKSKRFYATISWINLGFLLVCLVVFYIFARRHLKNAEDIEKDHVSPRDYTVMIYDIGPDEESKEYIENFVMSLLTEEQKSLVDIVKINIGKFEGNLIRLDKEIDACMRSLNAAEKVLADEELTENKQKIIQNKVLNGKSQLEFLRKKRLRYESRIKNEPSFKHNSIAFVTFSMQDQAKIVTQAQNRRRQIKRIIFKLIWCCSKKKIHYIRRAEEPDDIAWKFIGFTRYQRLMTLIVSYAITLGIIICSFAIQFCIRYLQSSFLNSNTDESTTWTNSIRVQLMQLISSSMIGIFNKILASITLKLSRYEKHLSTTQFLTSHTKKLIVFQVMNSAGCAVFLYLMP